MSLRDLLRYDDRHDERLPHRFDRHQPLLSHRTSRLVPNSLVRPGAHLPDRSRVDVGPDGRSTGSVRLERRRALLGPDWAVQLPAIGIAHVAVPRLQLWFHMSLRCHVFLLLHDLERDATEQTKAGKPRSSADRPDATRGGPLRPRPVLRGSRKIEHDRA